VQFPGDTKRQSEREEKTVADSEAYEYVSGAIEAETSLDRLEARGTVRLALKQAGLDPSSVSAAQMKVVLDRVLPAELAARGIDAAEDACSKVKSGLAGIADTTSGDTPEAVFSRLGGGS